MFDRESPEASAWVWDTWRKKSEFWPPICEIVKLYKDFRRGQREQAELIAQQEERRRLEDGRKRGEVVEFTALLKQLELAAAVNSEPMKRQQEFESRMRRPTGVKNLVQMVPALGLTEDEIAARRDRERAECEQYRDLP